MKKTTCQIDVQCKHWWKPLNDFETVAPWGMTVRSYTGHEKEPSLLMTFTEIMERENNPPKGKLCTIVVQRYQYDII